MSGMVESLTADLRNDAEKLASGDAVSSEIERKTIGRIGMLVCEMAGSLWPEEKLREVAREEAGKIVKSASAPSSSPGVRFFCLVDKYFVHVWWGFIVLCCIFGIREVLAAFGAGMKLF